MIQPLSVQVPAKGLQTLSILHPCLFHRRRVQIIQHLSVTLPERMRSTLVIQNLLEPRLVIRRQVLTHPTSSVLVPVKVPQMPIIPTSSAVLPDTRRRTLKIQRLSVQVQDKMQVVPTDPILSDMGQDKMQVVPTARVSSVIKLEKMQLVQSGQISSVMIRDIRQHMPSGPTSSETLPVNMQRMRLLRISSEMMLGKEQ